MNEEMFEELKESIRQAGAIIKEEIKPGKSINYLKQYVRKTRNIFNKTKLYILEKFGRECHDNLA